MINTALSLVLVMVGFEGSQHVSGIQLGKKKYRERYPPCDWVNYIQYIELDMIEQVICIKILHYMASFTAACQTGI